MNKVSLKVKELTGKGVWSETTKIQAVAMYMEMPNMVKVSELLGVSVNTLRNWKMEPWWFEVKNKILAEQDDEITTKFTKIVQKAQDVVVDRLDNGDWVVLKTGESKRKPVSAKDAAYISNNAVDKRQLLNDRPTSRVEKLTVDEKLRKLADQFERFTKAKEINAEHVSEIQPETPE
jgi:hypothetical protein